MPEIPKITINLKDENVKNDIEQAFLATHPMPKNAQGEPLFTPAQFVKHNVKAYLKGVLNQHKKEQAMAALSYTPVDDIEA